MAVWPWAVPPASVLHVPLERNSVGSPFPFVSCRGLVEAMSALKPWGGGGERPPKALNLGPFEPVDLSLALRPRGWVLFGTRSTDSPRNPVCARSSPAWAQGHYFLLFGSSLIHDFIPLGPLAHLPYQSLGAVGILSRNRVGIQQTGICPERGLCPPASAVPRQKPHP